MLIVPRASAPKGVQEAKRLLQEVANQRAKVSLLVFRDDDHRRQVASRADVRADGHPFRRVVWIPDPTVLEGEPAWADLVAADAAGDEALAMTLHFRVSSRLRGSDAVSFIRLEAAFARALAGIEET